MLAFSKSRSWLEKFMTKDLRLLWHILPLISRKLRVIYNIFVNQFCIKTNLFLHLSWNIFDLKVSISNLKNFNRFMWTSQCCRCLNLLASFTKSSEHKTNNHQPDDHVPLVFSPTNPATTNPMSHQRNNHQPIEKILSQRLENWKMLILQNKITTGKIENCS